MGIDFLYPEFEVIRNESRCIACRVCERQCANEVHQYSEARGMMVSDESRCVNCQRCVSLCPTRALKIVKSSCTLRENANWTNETIRQVYKQAATGGVLLSSMGNPEPFPVYWDRILINASQVTNPSLPQRALSVSPRRLTRFVRSPSALSSTVSARTLLRSSLVSTASHTSRQKWTTLQAKSRKYSARLTQTVSALR